VSRPRASGRLQARVTDRLLTNPAVNVKVGAMNQGCGGKQVIQIGDFARKAGISMRAIRYYEELGLISPDTHTVGGFRLYSEDALKRVRVITTLKDLGLSLVEIQRIFKAKKSGGSSRETVQFLLNLFTQKLGQVESKIEALIGVRGDLGNAVRILRSCENCDHDVLLDALLCGGCAHLSPRETVPDTLDVILS